jgi:hypothetical protein
VEAEFFVSKFLALLLDGFDGFVIENESGVERTWPVLRPLVGFDL